MSVMLTKRRLISTATTTTTTTTTTKGRVLKHYNDDYCIGMLHIYVISRLYIYMYILWNKHDPMGRFNIFHIYIFNIFHIPYIYCNTAFHNSSMILLSVCVSLHEFFINGNCSICDRHWTAIDGWFSSFLSLSLSLWVFIYLFIYLFSCGSFPFWIFNVGVWVCWRCWWKKWRFQNFEGEKTSSQQSL